MKRKALWFIAAVPVLVYLNNSHLLMKHPEGRPLLLAHRGLAQTFSLQGPTRGVNTARLIRQPEHPYLENTIPSMDAAFRAGADMVEFDVQMTKDGLFAVFHDEVLEHRTDGAGAVRDRTMRELKSLDIGYGYTADGGRTWPFRGRGRGLMPSLDEVLERFLGRSFLIHLKSESPAEADALARYFRSLPAARLERLAVYAEDLPTAVLRESVPGLRVMSKAMMKKALLTYELVGWTGYVPASMRNTHFHVPLKYARLLWGWPYRFIERMRAAGTVFFVVEGDERWSDGFDTAESLGRIPDGYVGGIWTDRIDRTGPVFVGGNDGGAAAGRAH